MDLFIGNYWNLLLLLLIPVLALFLAGFLKWRNRKRSIFANAKFHDVLFEKSSAFTKFFPLLYILAFLFLILSLLDFMGGSEELETEQKFSNVMFMLDISKSMNAEDVEPDRLERAKNIMIETMAKMKSDKVGIVIFAGDAISIMPLTSDYSSIETYISGITTDGMKVQGTDFLKGMQAVVQKFGNVNTSSRKVVLISDGEDNEGNENAAIKLANKENIVVTTVGVGTDEGAPVPEYLYGQLMGYKMDGDGETVISKRQVNALKKIADDTGGAYIDGNNFNEAPLQILDSLSKKVSSSKAKVKSQNAIRYYQYFLAISLLLFFTIYFFNPKHDFNV